ncbi:MAG TPA: hypothetical protein VN426_01300 [Syntrophomonadaceae bacterium]|nr:hypothetical protein [Syntrophomonadaceae bacterium]
MNKIKLLYDVAKVMKEKNTLAGTINVRGTKDEVEALLFTNEFSKDLASGWTRAKITTIIDHDGKQLKHESTTEFKRGEGSEQGHCGCMKHHHFHSGHAQMHGCGIKGKLDRFMFALNALDNMKILEQEDNSLLVTLDLTEIPADLKEALQEKMMHQHPGQHNFMAGRHSLESAALECRINKKYEVEAITAKIKGKHLDEKDASHDVALDAAIRFSY